MKNDSEEEINSNFQKKFFNLINNENENEIKNLLNSDNQYKIWEYRTDDEEDHLTVLHMAASRKNIEIMKMFLDYIEKKNKKDFISFINEKNKKGMTAIHYASFSGSLPIIKLLIEKGADETILTKKKLNVIHYCAEGNTPSCLMYYYFRFKNRDENDNANLLQLFKQPDESGSTPLHWAAYSGSLETLLYLINLDIFKDEEERQEFIDKKDNQERTPLHLSVNVKNSIITTKLLQYGATPNIKAALEKTPYELAKSKNLHKIATIINNYQKCHLFTASPVKKNQKSFNNIICLFLCLFLSAIIILFSTIPICLPHNLYGKIILIAYLVLLFSFFIVYTLLLCLNPGIVPANNKSILNGLIEKNTNLKKYCYKCFIPKKNFIIHCVICDKCLDGFDHHCYWINKCVAKKNKCLFKIFLVESFFYLVFSFILNCITLYNFIKNNLKLKYNYCWISIIEKVFKGKNDFLKYVHFIGNIFLFLMILLFLINEVILIIINKSGNCSKDNGNEGKDSSSKDNININNMEKDLDIPIISSDEKYTLMNETIKQE